MKLMNKGSVLRKWCRFIHRDLSFLFAGMMFVYAFSGILLNHRKSLNPHYSINRQEYKIDVDLSDKAKVDEALVLGLLEDMDEKGNYVKHYFPKDGELKVFLKGGSSIVINMNTGDAVYEQLTRRWLLSDMVKLHYNPGRWWTYFSDVFAFGLIIITMTGLFMLKGSKGLSGRGGILFLIGILIPILFIVL